MSSSLSSPSSTTSKSSVIVEDRARTSTSRSSQPDLTLFVQDMVDQMNSKFTKMGNTIMGRMTEMNSRMDELELSIADLMTQAGMDPVEQEREERGNV